MEPCPDFKSQKQGHSGVPMFSVYELRLRSPPDSYVTNETMEYLLMSKETKENPNSRTMEFIPQREGHIFRESKSGASIFVDLAIPNPKADEKGENQFISLSKATDMAFLHLNPKTGRGSVKVSLQPGVSLSGDFTLFLGESKEIA